MTDREAFEKWIKSEKPKTNLQKRDGRYLFADASSSWKAWQAAIAHERERGRLAMRDAVMASLDEAGIYAEVMRGMCFEVALERFDDAIRKAVQHD